MSETSISSPAAPLPSLARAFEGERKTLRERVSSGDMSAPAVVTTARQALDKCGTEFVKQTDDVALQKAGLWLLEMVKAGAGVLDKGAGAEIIWRELPKRPKAKIAGSTLFYGAAAVFVLAGIVQSSFLTIAAAGVLALLRFFDPADWKRLVEKIPLLGRKKPNVIEGLDGRKSLAEARVVVDGAGFVDGLADALRTADHILSRMTEPEDTSHWRDEPRLISFLQNLLEARAAGDADFALRLIETELTGLLKAEGIEALEYSKGQARLFDALPGLDLEDGPKQGAPALTYEGRVLKRGTVWMEEG